MVSSIFWKYSLRVASFSHKAMSMDSLFLGLLAYLRMGVHVFSRGVKKKTWNLLI